MSDVMDGLLYDSCMTNQPSRYICKTSDANEVQHPAPLAERHTLAQ